MLLKRDILVFFLNYKIYKKKEKEIDNRFLSFFVRSGKKKEDKIDKFYLPIK